MHIFDTVIRLRHTDAAGIVFFAAVFELAHECYESFLDIAAVLKEDKYIIPIVHAEADYTAPLLLADKVSIRMSLASTGNSSFKLEYEFVNHEKIAAAVKTVHTVIDRKTHSAIEIPNCIKNRLKEI